MQEVTETPRPEVVLCIDLSDEQCRAQKLCSALGQCASNASPEQLEAAYINGLNSSRIEGGLDRLTGITTSKSVGGYEQVMGYVRNLLSGNGESGGRQKPDHIALLFFDGDKFKDINTKHSHVIGDLVIKFLGSCLRSKEDVFCLREGGDEFVAIIGMNTEAMGVSDIDLENSLAMNFATALSRRIATRWCEEILKPDSVFKELFNLGLDIPSATVGVSAAKIEDLVLAGASAQDVYSRLLKEASLRATANKDARRSLPDLV